MWSQKGKQRKLNKLAISIMGGHTRIFNHESTQYKQVEAGHNAPQRTHLPHVSSAAVFSHAARKMLLQIPPSENSLIYETHGKQARKE
jgi:hypothetical protein